MPLGQISDLCQAALGLFGECAKNTANPHCDIYRDCKKSISSDLNDHARYGIVAGLKDVASTVVENNSLVHY